MSVYYLGTLGYESSYIVKARHVQDPHAHSVHKFFIRINFARIVGAQIPENQEFRKNHAEARFSLYQWMTLLKSKFLKMITRVL